MEPTNKPTRAKRGSSKSNTPKGNVDLEQYMNGILRRAVATICYEEGFRRARPATLDTLADLVSSFCWAVGQSARESAEATGRSEVNVTDVARSFPFLGVTARALRPYAEAFAVSHPRCEENQDGDEEEFQPTPIVLPPSGVPKPAPHPVYSSTSAATVAKNTLSDPPCVPAHWPPFPAPDTLAHGTHPTGTATHQGVAMPAASAEEEAQGGVQDSAAPEQLVLCRALVAAILDRLPHEQHHTESMEDLPPLILSAIGYGEGETTVSEQLELKNGESVDVSVGVSETKTGEGDVATVVQGVESKNEHVEQARTPSSRSRFAPRISQSRIPVKKAVQKPSGERMIDTKQDTDPDSDGIGANEKDGKGTKRKRGDDECGMNEKTMRIGKVQIGAKDGKKRGRGQSGNHADTSDEDDRESDDSDNASDQSPGPNQKRGATTTGQKRQKSTGDVSSPKKEIEHFGEEKRSLRTISKPKGKETKRNVKEQSAVVKRK